MLLVGSRVKVKGKYGIEPTHYLYYLQNLD